MRYSIGFIGALALSLTALWAVAFSIQGCGGGGNSGDQEGCIDGDRRCLDFGELVGGGAEVELCEDDRWTWDSPCADGKICVDTDPGEVECQSPCKAGETECSADRDDVKLCNADDRWEVSETCRGSECQVTDGVAACGPVTCRPGATRCEEDDTEVWTCAGGGDAWNVTATCESNQSCEVFKDVAQCVVIAPMITEVKWQWKDPCSYMTPSDVSITTTVVPTGPDLRYSGSVSFCTGDIDASVAVLTCENETLMSGSVAVTDSAQNRAEVGFTFDACQDGRVCAGGQPCCTEGTTRCSETGHKVERCGADGAWDTVEDCAISGERCYMNGPVAECREAGCTEGDRRCIESDALPGTDIEYCFEGSWVLSQSCQQQDRGWVCNINDTIDPPVYYCGAP